MLIRSDQVKANPKANLSIQPRGVNFTPIDVLAPKPLNNQTRFYFGSYNWLRNARIIGMSISSGFNCSTWLNNTQILFSSTYLPYITFTLVDLNGHMRFNNMPANNFITTDAITGNPAKIGYKRVDLTIDAEKSFFQWTDASRTYSGNKYFIINCFWVPLK